MKFLLHFDAKLEYLVHRLELQPNGAKSSDRDQNAGGAGNVRRLDDFRSAKATRERRAAGKTAG